MHRLRLCLDWVIDASALNKKGRHSCTVSGSSSCLVLHASLSTLFAFFATHSHLKHSHPANTARTGSTPRPLPFLSPLIYSKEILENP